MRYGQPRTIGFSFSSRRRCILFDQSLRFQFGPEFTRNVGLHRGIVSENLLFTAGADYQSCSYGGCRSELKRCGTQVHPVIGRHFPQSFPFFQEFDRNLVRLFPIVVARAPRDESGVQGGANHQGSVLFSDCRKKLVQCILVIDQGILRGHQTDIWIGFAEYSQNRRGRIHLRNRSRWLETS